MNALIEIGKDMVCFFCLLMDVTAGRAVNMPTTIFSFIAETQLLTGTVDLTHTEQPLMTWWLQFGSDFFFWPISAFVLCITTIILHQHTDTIRS